MLGTRIPLSCFAFWYRHGIRAVSVRGLLIPRHLSSPVGLVKQGHHAIRRPDRSRSSRQLSIASRHELGERDTEHVQQ